MSHSQAVTLSSAIVLLLGLILSLNKTSAEYQKDQVDNFYIEAVEAGVNKLKAYLQKMMQSQLYLIAPSMFFLVYFSWHESTTTNVTFFSCRPLLPQHYLGQLSKF